MSQQSRSLTSEFRSAAPWAVPALVILMLGLGYRFVTLGEDALNCDELYSWSVSKLSYLRILSENFDVHPPFFYLVLKSFSLFGSSEFVLRLTSALAGVGVVAAVFQFARTRVGLMAASGGALCLLFSFKHIVYSSLARNYSLELLLCFCAGWVLTIIADRLTASPADDRIPISHLATYGLLAAAALATHSMAAVFLLVLNGLVFVVYAVHRPKAALRLGLVQAAANAPGYILFAAWYFSAAQNQSDFDWLMKFPPGQALKIYAAAFAPTGLPIPVVLAAAVAVALGYVVSLVRAPRAFIVLETSLLILLPLALYLISLRKPVYMERTIIFEAPGAALAIAALLAAIGTRAVRLGVGGALLAIFIASSTLYILRGPERESYGMEPIQDFRQSVRQAEKDRTGSYAILTCETFTEPAFRYYGGGARPDHLVLEPPHGVGALIGDWREFWARPTSVRKYAAWVKEDPALLKRYDRIDYVDVGNFCTHDTQRRIVGALNDAGFRETSKAVVQGVAVRVFDRPAPSPRGRTKRIS